MLSNLKCAIREFFGIPQMQTRICESLSRMHQSLADSQNKPVLATVTILCVMGGRDEEGKERTTRTTLGGEAFLYPDQSANIKIYPQRTTSRFTYFVSGHPNLVVTSFKVGNETGDSDCAGKKYGECDFTVDVGNIIQVRIEYRKEGQTLL